MFCDNHPHSSIENQFVLRHHSRQQSSTDSLQNISATVCNNRMWNQNHDDDKSTVNNVQSGDDDQDSGELSNPAFEMTSMSTSPGGPSILPRTLNALDDDERSVSTLMSTSNKVRFSKHGLQLEPVEDESVCGKSSTSSNDMNELSSFHGKPRKVAFDLDTDDQGKTPRDHEEELVIEPDHANFVNSKLSFLDTELEKDEERNVKNGFLGNVKAKFPKKKRRNKLGRVTSPILMSNLVDAVRRGDMENMKNLLTENSSFNLNKLDKSNLALLHYASIQDRDFIARELLRRGADVDVLDLDIKATPLHAAARMNSVNVAHVLLARCADVDRKTSTGLTPLHISARRGHEEITNILLTLGRADVHARDAENATALHAGAMSGNVAVCKLLVKHGADIRAKDVNSMTPLMKAVVSGHVTLVDMFLERAHQIGLSIEAYINDEDIDGNTCLHLAVSKRRSEVIQRLFGYRMSPNLVKKNGMGPLHIAAINGSTGVALHLIQNGAEIDMKDDEGMTPLHRATFYNQVETMALLIHEGAMINEIDNIGFTPLLCAACKGHTPAGELLLSRGADIFVFDMHRKSPLHWAAETDHLGFVEFLLKNGGYRLLEITDIYEQTALHYAAEAGNVEMIKKLIQYEVKGEVRDMTEKTPVHIAAQAGYLSCVEELLHQTPLLLNDEDQDGMTPLLIACYHGHRDLVKTLLKIGADITSVNDDHRTALMLAAMNNHVETMSILIEHNCDIHALDKYKNSALHLSVDGGHIGPANLLIRAGADQSASNNEGFTPLELAIDADHGEIAAAIIKSRDWRIAMQSKDELMISPMKALIEKLPDVALLVMDRCVHKTYTEQHITSYDVKYEYQYIDPGPDDESTRANGYRYFAIRTMCQYGREKLLAHELSQSVLKRKWNRFARVFFYIDLLFYVAFTACLTTHITLASVPPDEAYWDEVNNVLLKCPSYNLSLNPELKDTFFNGAGSNSLWYVNPAPFYTGYAILVYCVTMIFGELAEMYTLRLKYFTEMVNLVDWATLATAVWFVLPPGRAPCFHNWNAGIVAIFLSWMKLIMYLRSFKTTGLYVLMFIETLISLVKAMTVFIMFVIAFTFTFRMLFSTQYRFSTTDLAFMSTMTMMLGEMNKDDIFNEENDLTPYEVTSYFCFLVFIFLMPMVLNNLTIGIAVGDIEGIRKKAFIKRNSVQADYVYHLENKCPLWLQRFLYQSEYIIRVQKERYRNKFTSMFFPREDEALIELDDKSEPRNAEHVLEELQRQKFTLASLKLMVRQQGDILQRLADKEGVASKVQDIKGLAELFDEQPTEEMDQTDPTSSIA
ncbi:transient receptor potential cation channel subfamily A member 1-like [Lytechinus pictus]|uniref:transient receptor potential cation channel subfamily A member 1-like n=1 Tax=Lytechinus pictus TaxID=7653 RepID=UPI0030BA1627